MTTQQNPKDTGDQAPSPSTSPEKTGTDGGKQRKKDRVIIDCIVALLLPLFPLAPVTTIFLIAVVLLTIFLGGVYSRFFRIFPYNGT